jgi:hypothetical protein
MAPPAFEDATALLYVLSQPGPSLPLSEYNTWYDTDHGPSRKSVPGVLSASRYQLISSNPQSAEWLAVYELSSPFVLKSKKYIEQWENQSTYEKELLDKCEIVDRRVYTLYSRRSREDYPERRGDGEEVKKKRVFQTVALEPGRHSSMTEDDFDEWYHEEHLDDMHRVPGWMRSTRWVLQDVKGGNMKEIGVDKMPPKFLAIHEYEDEGFRSTKEFKEANETPTRLRIVPMFGKNAERGFWRLWREF